MTTRNPVFKLALVAILVVMPGVLPVPCLYADDSPTSTSSRAEGSATSDSDTSVNTSQGESSVTPFTTLEPRSRKAGREGKSSPDETVNWTGLARQSGEFLGIMHGFRLMTEQGTRDGLKGKFFDNWGRAAGNLHGWADGDDFYVNYVGHPMQGAVAGYIWINNDRKYSGAEFGQNRLYWKSRLRAAAFAWAESAQFEIGPLSEADIGSIQAYFPQQGFVDHVITPVVGLGWMIAEDSMDKYVVKRIEYSTENKWIRLATRTGLNPARSFANLIAGIAPWHRDDRPGIYNYHPKEEQWLESLGVVQKPVRVTGSEAVDTPGVAPFEFNLTFQPELMFGGGTTTACLGGGGTGARRLSPSWQFVVDVGGCKLRGIGQNLSGDSLTYLGGVRWSSRFHGSWRTYTQLLVGGNKLTEERMYPERKKALELLAQATGGPPPTHDQYTSQDETNGFAVQGGGGVDYKLNSALAIRVVDLEYRHSWVAPLGGRDLSNGMKFTSGLVLRMGTW